jgi:hypothetical protein
MPGRDDVLCRERLAWLLVIGQRLKLEYDALARPLPPALATLLQQLEAHAKLLVDLRGQPSDEVGRAPVAAVKRPRPRMGSSPVPRPRALRAPW